MSQGARPDPSKFVEQFRQEEKTYGKAEWLPYGAQMQTPRGPSDEFSNWDAQGITTGQNLRGMENGWNTGFMQKFYREYGEAADRNEALDYFRNKRDGIALWDDEEAGIKFGDVFYGGEKVENLYDSYGKEFADTVMRPYVTGATEQLHQVSVDQRRQENTQRAAEARAAVKGQGEFDTAVAEEKDSWDQAAADAMTVVGGALGGAMSGAGTGALVAGPWGAVASGVVGLVAGGVGAWLNRDELQDLYARTEVQAEMAEKEFNQAAGFSQRLQGWGAMAGQLSNPLSQLTRGLYDDVRGDRRSKYHEIDQATGEMTRPGWVTALDVAASVQAAAGQFASGVGVGVFQAQMLAQIGGKTTTLVATGGEAWDDQRAGYRNVFVDEETGELTPGRAAAGLGVVAIDVAQLGLARSLMFKAGSVGRGSASSVGSQITGTAAGAKNADALALGLKPGGRVQASGRIFKMDAAGNISSRMTATAFMAPSELIEAASVRVMAATQTRGAITSADLLTASQRMMTNARVWPNSVVNGFGEAAEEATQAVLEEAQFGRVVDARDVMMSALYGGAMGFGMTVGSSVRGLRGDKARSKRFDQMQAKWAALNDGAEFPREQWDKMSRREQDLMLASSAEVDPLLRAEAERIRQEQSYTEFQSNTAALVRRETLNQIAAAEANSANWSSEATYIVSKTPDSVPDHMAHLSLNTLTRYFEIANEVRMQQAAEASPELKARLEEISQVTATLLVELKKVQSRFYSLSESQQVTEVGKLNQLLADMWEIKDEATDVGKARAVTLSLLRNPPDSAGSMQVFLPQVSVENSRETEPGSGRGRGEAMVQIGIGPITPMGGDFDGDTVQALTRQVLTDAGYRAMRTGETLIQPDRSKAGDPLVRVAIDNTEYEAAAIEVLGDAIKGLGSRASRAAANAALAEIRVELLPLFSSINAVQVLDRFVDQVSVGLRSAKQNMLSDLASNYGAEMQQLGQSSWRNPWYEVNSKVRLALWHFHGATATGEAQGLRAQITPNDYNSVDATTDYGRVLKRMAATATQTLWETVAGTELFRKWQALNYTKLRSGVPPAQGDELSVHQEMARTYLRLSSGMIDSRHETLMGSDNVTGRVASMLQKLARELEAQGQVGSVSPVMLANMRVPDVRLPEVEGELGVWGDQSNLTLTQWLLQREVDREQQRARGGETAEMESRWNMLRRLSPEAAFVKVFGSYQMRAVLGIAGDVFGGNQTVDQVASELVNMSTAARQAAKANLRRHATYNTEVDGSLVSLNDDVSAYQVVVDSLLKFAPGEITYDRNAKEKHLGKQLGGRLGDSERETSRVMRAALETMHRTLSAMKGVDRRSEASLQKFLDRNDASVIGPLMMTLPPEARVLATTADGRLAPWVVQALQADDVAQAEMALWRGALIADWHAKGVSSEDGVSGRSFSKLTNRIHLLMYMLEASGSKQRQTEFLKALNDATNIHEFIAFLNDPASGFRPDDSAPFMAYHMDVAEIDPSATAGSLTQVLEGSERRKAISDFHQKMMNFNDAFSQEASRNAAEAEIRAELQEAVRVQADTGVRSPLLTRLQKRIDFVTKMGVTLGPAAMFRVISGNLLMLTNAADKGKSPDFVAHLGDFDIRSMMPTFATAEEAVLDSMSAIPLSELLNNPRWLTKAHTVIDNDGNLYKWPGLTAESFIEMEAREENRPLLRAIMHPSMMELTASGRMETQYLTDMKLQDLVLEDAVQERFAGVAASDAYTQIAFMDGLTENHELMRYVMDVVAAKTSALTSSIQTMEQAGQLTHETLMEIAELIRVLSPLADLPNPSTAGVPAFRPDGTQYTYVPKTALEALMAEKLYDRQSKSLTPKEQAQRELMLQLFELDAAKRFQVDGDADAFTGMMEWLADLGAQNSGDVLAPILRAFGVDDSTAKNDPSWFDSTRLARGNVAAYIKSHGSMLAKNRGLQSVARIFNAYNVGADGLEELTPAQWAEASRAVIADRLQDTITMSVSGSGSVAIKELSRDGLKYFDPQFSFVLRDLMDPDGPIMKAAREFNREFGVNTRVDPIVAGAMIDKVFSPAKFGELTDAITVNMMQGNERVFSSGNVQGVSAGGTIPKTFEAETKATEYTFDDPIADGLTPASTTLKLAQLETRAPLTVTHPDGSTSVDSANLLEGRFIVRGTITAGGASVDLSGLRQLPTMQFTNTPTLDTLSYDYTNPRLLSNAVKEWAQVNNVDPKDVDIELEFYHPKDKPSVEPELTAKYANNIFFDGVVADASTYHPSAVAAWVMGAGGVDQTSSTRALQAAKKARMALLRPDLVDADTMERLHTGWESDLYGTLERLTNHYLETTDSSRIYFNALLKVFMLRRAVRLEDGTVISAQQAIEMQKAGPLQNAELLSLSTHQLATMLGDDRPWGNRITRPQRLTLHRTAFNAWTGSFSEVHKENLPGFFKAPTSRGVLVKNPPTIFDAHPVGPTVARKLTGYAFTPQNLSNAYSENVRFAEERVAQELREERYQQFGYSTAAEQLKEAARHAFQMAGAAIKADDAIAGLQQIGLPVTAEGVNARDTVNKAVQQELQKFIEASASRLARVYHHSDRPSQTRREDLLGVKSLSNEGKARYLHIGPGDPVTVMLDEFRDDQVAELHTVLNRLMGYGAVVLLGTDTPMSRIAIEARAYMAAHQYNRMAGAQNIFYRRDLEERPVSAVSRYDRAVEMEPLFADNLSAVFNSNRYGIEENVSYVLNTAAGQHKAIVSAYSPIKFPGFGLVNANTVDTVLERIKAMRGELIELNRELGKGIKHLHPGTKKLDAELNRAIDKLLTELQADGQYAAGATLQFGDIIPLYDEWTGRLILHRHGYKLPKPEQVHEMLSGGRSTMLYLPERSADTAYEGTILSSELDAHWGLKIRMRVPLQQIAGKLQGEGDGAKHVAIATPEIDAMEFPEVFQNFPLTQLQSEPDALSKNNFRNYMDNFRNAFGLMGVDFRPELARVMFGSDSAEHQAWVEPTLRAMTSVMERVPKVEAIRMDSAALFSQDIADALESAAPGRLRQSAADLLTELQQSQSVDHRIMLATMRYLMYEHADISDILAIPGVNSATSMDVGKASWTPPRLFSDAFENLANEDPLRAHLVNKLQKQFPNQAGGGVGWKLNLDLSVTVSTPNSEWNGTGYLQFVELETALANPVFNEWSGQSGSRQVASSAQQQVLSGTLGATQTIDRDLPRTRALAATDWAAELKNAESVLQMLTAVPQEKHVKLRHFYSKGALEYMTNGRDRVKSWRRELDTKDWSEDDTAAYMRLRTQVAEYLGFNSGEEGIVDTWVRQWAGRPGLTKRQMGKMSPAELQQAQDSIAVSAHSAMLALAEVKTNVENGRLPVAAGAVPQMHISDLVSLKAASERSSSQFKLKKTAEGSETTAEWVEWLAIARSFGDNQNEMFDPMYLADVDAMHHSYADSRLTLLGLPVSVDLTKALSLMEEHSTLSVSPERARQLELDEEAAGGRDFIGYANQYDAESALAERVRRTKTWYSKNGIATPVGATSRDFVEHGLQLTDKDNASAAFLRSALHLRATLALANPLLVPGAAFEFAIQSIIDRSAGTLLGNSSTPGIASQALEALVGGLTQEQVSTNLRSQEEAAATRKAIEVIGSRSEFLSMIGLEFKMQRPNVRESRPERALRGAAEWAGRLQDPTFGIPQGILARHYVDVVSRNLMLDAPDVSMETVAHHLIVDPTWVQKRYPAIHQRAINHLSDLKSMRATVASVMWRSVINPLTESPRAMVSWPTVFFVRMPFMFANFGFNAATRILGLQAVDQLAAAFLHGRKKGMFSKNIYKPLMSKITGINQTDLEQDSFYDFSDVLVDVDLAHAVAKSGVSLTNLAAFAMLAGAAGLTGEDEEDKRLRRAWIHQGAAVLHNPADLINDFRNAEALYLDNIPVLGDIVKAIYQKQADDPDTPFNDSKSPVEMNFILKQVLSPVMGVARFAQTGNPWEILWGAYDAVASLPLVSTMIYDDAARTYAELVAQAGENADGSKNGSPEGMPETFNSILAGVFKIERMLLESSFINMLYVGLDKYDRDPWRYGERTGTGDLMTDRLGNVRRSEGLDQRIDETTGEIGQTYAKRDWQDAQLHAMAEKRGTFALLMQLNPWGSGDWIRTRQPVKIRTFQRPEMTEEDGLAYIEMIWKSGRIPSDLENQGVFLSPDSRERIEYTLREQLGAELRDAGLAEWQVSRRLYEIFNGPADNPEIPGLYDIIWSRKQFENTIPFKQTTQFRQLNTTYVLGPDGNYWATGVNPSAFADLFGMVWVRPYHGAGANLEVDSRLNTVNPFGNMNTGMRALELIDLSQTKGADELADERRHDELLDSIEKLTDALKGDKKTSGGSGWRNFARRAWRNFGRRGGGGGGGGGSFTRLNAPQDSYVPGANTTQSINTFNPNIRRATIRRERSDSEKGRLKPWQ